MRSSSIALALLLAAAAPVATNAQTIFDNFLSALAPARPETPPAQPETQAKAPPQKKGARPGAIAARAASPAAAPPTRPAVPRAIALPPDRDVITGGTAQAPVQEPSAPQAQPSPQAPPAASAPVIAPASAVAAPAPKPAAAPAAPKAAAKPRNDAAAKAKPAAPSTPAPADAATDSDAALFCRNIADAASDARFSWQVKMLEDLDKQVKESMSRLEAKRAEYEDWLKRREDFLHKVEDGVVEMYGRMRPDAAAQQIASMTEEVALSVLMKLKPRTSSAILGEMEPTRAARLTDSLAGVRLTTREQGKAP
jgi:flagellar motility protein MotE (MotC chaperone)